jgi:hypothetical protein
MANTLHFIPEQEAFLTRALSIADRFVIVEYEQRSQTDGDHIQLASNDSVNSSPRQE